MKQHAKARAHGHHRAHLRARDSFDMDPDSVDATDYESAPDQWRQKGVEEPHPEDDPGFVNEEDYNANTGRYSVFRSSHNELTQNRKYDTYDHDDDTVSRYDGMHGAEYTPRKFEGVMMEVYEPREF